MPQQMDFDILQKLNNIQKKIDAGFAVSSLLSNLKCYDDSKSRQLEVREYDKNAILEEAKAINSEHVPDDLRLLLVKVAEEYEDRYRKLLSSITITGLDIDDIAGGYHE